MAAEIDRIKVLVAGILGLVLMLGVARFAYTPLLPLMQAQAGLGSDIGAWLASINYLGYLSGALIAASISDMQLKDRLYRVGILLAIVTTLAMALTTDWRLWAALRYLAGLSSAAGLLLGSGLVLNWLMRHHYRSELGVHFAGIGIGIALTALAVELTAGFLDWQAQWFWFAAIGVLLAIPAWVWLPRPGDSGLTVTGETLADNPPSPLFLKLFMAAYFCCGIGYVISATFIVAIIEQQPGLEGQGNWVFMLIGLSAMPACIIWDRVARRVGVLNALIAAALIHVLGVALPLLFNTQFGVLASAVLFGSTFIGIVSLVLALAGRYYPSRPSKMMGKMTLTYSVSQMVAPALLGMLAGPAGGYVQGLLLATVAMIAGSGLLVALKLVETRELGAKAQVVGSV